LFALAEGRGCHSRYGELYKLYWPEHRKITSALPLSMTTTQTQVIQSKELTHTCMCKLASITIQRGLL
jgi:hypothetical protein